MIRKVCVVCDSSGFKQIYTQPEYPLCISSSDFPSTEDCMGDLEFIGCTTCGCVQLKTLIDPKILYSFTHNNTYETPTWSSHHNEFAQFILSHTEQNRFIEVGGASGYLARLLQKERSFHKFTIIDLTESAVSFDGSEYIQGNCEEYDFSRFSSTAPVILSHVFEHLYNPRKFIRKLQEANTQTVFISVPNMRACLEKEFLSFLHVEHTYYCEEGHILRMFYEGGYVCKTIRLFRDHSLFFWFERGTTQNVPVYPNADRILETFQNYYAKRDASYKHIQLEHPTYIVPAGHYGQLVYFYLHNQRDKVLGFLDNDKTKVGKRMYGTDKIVYKVADIASQKEHRISILLNAGPYNKELKEQLKAYHPNIDFIDTYQV